MRQRHAHVSENRFSGALGEAIENALKESENFLQQMQATVSTPVPDVESVLEKIGEKWHLSDETQNAVKNALKREPASQQQSLFGLVNAFTSAAQTLNGDKRYDLEVLAGNLAANGVNAYASRKKRKESADAGNSGHNADSDPDGVIDLEPTTEQQSSHPVAEPSIMELAREMFDAEIVGRVPNGRQP
jgi:hypothetical protein